MHKLYWYLIKNKAPKDHRSTMSDPVVPQVPSDITLFILHLFAYKITSFLGIHCHIAACENILLHNIGINNIDQQYINAVIHVVVVVVVVFFSTLVDDIQVNTQ